MPLHNRLFSTYFSKPQRLLWILVCCIVCGSFFLLRSLSLSVHYACDFSCIFSKKNVQYNYMACTHSFTQHSAQGGVICIGFSQTSVLVSEADGTISVDVIVMSGEDLDADVTVTASVQGMGTAQGGYCLISRMNCMHACMAGMRLSVHVPVIK